MTIDIALRLMLALRRTYRGALRRFTAKVERRGPDDCWLWTGACRSRTGNKPATYGFLRVKGRLVLAHRFALFGPFEHLRHERALHSCDNSLCENPAHLFAGTRRDNVLDMVRKGRAWLTRGARGRFTARAAA